MTTTEKIEVFAKRVEDETIQRLHESKMDCEANIANARTSVKPGKKYAKVDIGNSGRYMVEMETGNIFGIKAYGQIHRGHFYGTVETINDYFWGGYYPVKQFNPTPLREGTIPKLTFVPTA
jgi:hypothetical protein